MVDLHGRDARGARPGMPTRLPQLHVRVARVTDARVVTVAGEIDLATVDELRESLDALDGRIVVDLAAVSFIDATGLGVLAGTRKRLRSCGGDLGLRAPQDQVRRVLEVVGLDDWIIEESARAESDAPATVARPTHRPLHLARRRPPLW